MNDYVWHLKYSPDQARVPAGSSEGGRWTSGSDREVYYHLTRPENLESIQREGFRPSVSGELGPGVYFATDPKYLTDPRYSGASRLVTKINAPLLTVPDAPNLGLAIFRKLYGREEGTRRWDETSASEWFAPGGFNWEFLQGHIKKAGFGGMSVVGGAIPKSTVVFDPKDIEILNVEEVAGE